MVKKLAKEIAEVQEEEHPIIDPDASIREAERNAAIYAELAQAEPLIESGYGLFTFDADAKAQFIHHGVYRGFDEAKAAAHSYPKEKDAVNLLIPIAYFC